MSLLPGRYHQWRLSPVTIAGHTVRVASKPGVSGFGREDAATRLLAEALVQQAPMAAGVWATGNGLPALALLAAQPAVRLDVRDRLLPNLHAVQRALEAVGADATRVRCRHAHGLETDAPPFGMDVVAVRLPPDKRSLMGLLRDAGRALRAGGTCLLAGNTDEGIKSAQALLEEAIGPVHTLASGGGTRLYAARAAGPEAIRAQAAALPARWHDPVLDATHFHEVPVQLRGAPVTLSTRPGVFSWEHLDLATALLAEHVDVPSGATVLDLGCGAGALAVVASRCSGGAPLWAVDADREAVRCAERTLARAGCPAVTVCASDVTSAVADRRFDVVVSNPPFHVGKATDLLVPAAFIAAAHDVLRPGGTLQLVANRTLPYERLVEECFGAVRSVATARGFKVLAATRSG